MGGLLKHDFWAAFLWFSVAALAPGWGSAHAQDSLQPGEAFATRFSGTTSEAGRTIINVRGTVGSIIDLRNPGTPPRGSHWLDEPQRLAVTAGQIGQVFGTTLDDANPPNGIVRQT